MSKRQFNKKLAVILVPPSIIIGTIAIISSCSYKKYDYPDPKTIHNFSGTDWFDYKSGDVINVSIEKDRHGYIDGYYQLDANCSWIGNLDIPMYIHDSSGKGIYEFSIVGYGAFKNCTTLNSIDLNSAKEIQSEAFWGCTGLNNINFGTVSTIASNAFLNCTALTSLDFKYIQNYGRTAFQGCNALQSIKFRHIAEVQDLCFQNAAQLNSIDFTTLNFNNWNDVEWGANIFGGISTTGNIKANTIEQANGWLNLLKRDTNWFGTSFVSWGSQAN